jgi:GDPmannose 4,6-dehydratase
MPNATGDYVKDYARMMWMILQADEAEDQYYTGTTTPVREFVRMSFAEVGIELEFKGEGIEERGYVKRVTTPFQEIGKEILKWLTLNISVLQK